MIIWKCVNLISYHEELEYWKTLECNEKPENLCHENLFSTTWNYVLKFKFSQIIWNPHTWIWNIIGYWYEQDSQKSDTHTHTVL